MQLLVVLLLVVPTAALAYSFPAVRLSARSRRAVRPRLCDAETPISKEEQLTIAKEKRLAADRLALQAERAELEAERVALEAEAMKIVRKRAELAAEPATAPAAPDVARPTTPAPTPTEPALVLPGLNSTFNLEEALNNVSDAPSPPTGGLALALRRTGLSAAELQVSDAQVTALRETVFDLESFYVMKVEQTDIGTVFSGNLRTTSDKVFARVCERQAAVPELEGVRLLLMDDPCARAAPTRHLSVATSVCQSVGPQDAARQSAGCRPPVRMIQSVSPQDSVRQSAGFSPSVRHLTWPSITCRLLD